MESESIITLHILCYLSHVFINTLISSKVSECIFQKLYINNRNIFWERVVSNVYRVSIRNEAETLNREDNEGKRPIEQGEYCLGGNLL